MRFQPSQTNNFYKIDQIIYVMKVKLECLDTVKHEWTGCPKSLRVAPVSGIGQRWFQSLNIKLNQTPVSSPAQDQLLQNFIASKLTLGDDLALTLGSLEGVRRDMCDPDNKKIDENDAFEARIKDFATESGPAKEVTLIGCLDTPLNKTGNLLSSNVPISLTFIKANDYR